MLMVFILNEFLIHGVSLDPLGSKPSRKESNEIVLKLAREIRNVSTRTFSNDKHLAEMSFRLSVAFEAILVSTLLLTDLTVPSQPLKPFGLHLVGEVLGGSDFSARHVESME